MPCNFATSEKPFNGEDHTSASSLFQGSTDELCVTFELPFYLKCTRNQKCYLNSFPLLPAGFSKSTLKLSLHSTEREDFYIPYDSTAPNPVSDGEDKGNVYIKPSGVVYRPLAEFRSLPKDPRVEPSCPTPDVFQKLPRNFNVPIQHPPIEGECTVLVLLLLGERCYPFCVESSTPYPQSHISIDGKRYVFRETLRFADPQCLNEGLTVILLIRNGAHTLSIPAFNANQEIELKISSMKYQIILGSHTKPSFTVADFLCDSHYFNYNTYNIRMKRNSFDEISVPENCDAPVFNKKCWSNGDQVELITERLRESSFALGDKVGINIGSKGTLSLHQSGARVFLGNGLFRIFIKENNDLIALQKFLKVSVKLSRYEK